MNMLINSGHLKIKKTFVTLIIDSSVFSIIYVYSGVTGNSKCHSLIQRHVNIQYFGKILKSISQKGDCIEAWLKAWSLSHSSCGTLGKLLILSVHHFHYL